MDKLLRLFAFICGALSLASFAIYISYLGKHDSENHTIPSLIGYAGVASVNLAIFAALAFWSSGRIAAERARPQQAMAEMHLSANGNERDAALIAEQEQFQSVLKTVPSAMLILDDVGAIKAFSASAERLFGYAAHEAIGLNIDILTPEPDGNKAGSFLDRYLAGGTSHVTDGPRVLCARRRDGTLVPIDLWMGAIHDGSHPLYTGFFKDLTERLAAEERLGEMRDQLLHVSRLSAMGEMAADLAHELNQPLAATAYFIGAADLVLAEDANREQGRALLRLGGEQVLRGAEIIRRMRGFATTEDPDMQMGSIYAIIKDAVAMAFLGEALNDIHLIYDFDPKAEIVLADRIQIGQVFFNLLRNAAEELRKCAPGARSITIATKVVAAEMTELSVADSGPGLDPLILDKLCKPFASTKSKNGMGVGLSICRRIVEAHCGTFDGANRAGGGAIFRFTLHRATAKMLGAPA